MESKCQNINFISQKYKSIFDVLLRDIVLIFLFVILLFQPIIVFYFKNVFTSYIDEVACIIMLLILILKFKSLINYLNNNSIQKKMIFAFALFLIVGILSSLINRKQTLVNSLLDMFICSKFLVAYLFIKVYYVKCDVFSSKMFKKFIYLTVLIFFISFVADVFLNIFPRYDVRYGLGSIQLFTGHPFNLSLVCISLILILTSYKTKTSKLCIIASLIILASTLRTASLCFCGVYLITRLFKFLNLKNPGFILSSLIFFFAIIVGYQQIMTYYSVGNGSVRNIMLNDALKIASENFPFGLGFGTFGSTIAIQTNSPIYTLYNYYSLWLFNNFATDSFLALSLGQFGYIGTFLILYVMLSLFFAAITNKNKEALVGLVPFIIYILISILSFTSIFHPSIFFAMLIYSYCEEIYKNTVLIKHEERKYVYFSNSSNF